MRIKDITLVGVLGLLIKLQLRSSVPLREYDYYLLIAVADTGIFVGGGTVAKFIAPTIVHWSHGLGALLMVAGLYRLPDATSHSASWFDIPVQNPRRVRRQEDWMSPADDRILEICAGVDLVLTPSIIAYNIEYSREEVNRRLSELERHSLIERVDRGKCRIEDN